MKQLSKEEITSKIKEVATVLNKYESLIPGFDKVDAIRLLAGTMAVESDFTHQVQLGGGPARSYLQVEPKTAFDNNFNYIAYRPKLVTAQSKATKLKVFSQDNIKNELLENFEFAVFHARLKYYRSPVVLLSKSGLSSVEQLAYFWKKVYNTELGASHRDEKTFIEKFNQFDIDGIVRGLNG